MAKPVKRGLGRGLDSILSSSFPEKPILEEPSAPKRIMVSSDTLISEPSQPSSPVLQDIPPDDIPLEEIIETQSEFLSATDFPSVQQEAAVSFPSSQAITPPSIVPSQEQIIPPLEKGDEFIKENGMEVTIKSVKERVVDEVPLLRIRPNPNQPRTYFDKEELEELAESIKKDGLLQPILVRSLGDNQYEIIAGERRWQAAKMAGLHRIPIRVREADDTEALELALIENIQRSDLNPIEEAYGYKRIMERQGLSQSEVAQLVSKGRSTIANSLRLLDLPEEAQRLLYEGKITAGHARAILSIPTLEGKQSLTDKLLNESMTVREAESLARLLAGKKNKTTSSPAEKEPTPPSYRLFARTLKQHLSTNVKVKTSGGKNRIEIEFEDEDDLKRIFDIFNIE